MEKRCRLPRDPTRIPGEKQNYLVQYFFRTDDSGSEWPLPFKAYAFSFFFFPAWCTFENINPCPRRFIARKINSLTYKGAMPTPPSPPPNKIILSLFFLEDKTLAPDVFSSCQFIPRAYFEASLVIVRCYGYKI